MEGVARHHTKKKKGTIKIYIFQTLIIITIIFPNYTWCERYIDAGK